MIHTESCTCDTCLRILLTSPDQQEQQRGWEAWYARDGKKLQCYINQRCHRLGCMEQRDDLLQDVFIIGFRNVATGKFQEQGNTLCAYLYGIARNCIFDVVRRQQKEIPDNDYLASCPDSALSLDDLFYLEKTLRHIVEAYNQLTEPSSIVLDGLYNHEKTSDEVGQELHKSADNIRTIARRAIVAIRKYLVNHHKLDLSSGAVRTGLRILYAREIT